MRAMLRATSDEGQALVELRGVDGSYPHGGTLRLEDGTSDGQRLLAKQDGIYGALVAPELLDRLHVAVGDSVRLGTETLQIRGVIRSEPDRLSSGIGFGPRVLVSIDALKASGLVRPGSLIEWIYRIRLPEGANDIAAIGRMRGEADRLFPEAGWSKRSRDNAAPSLKRNIEHFGAVPHAGRPDGAHRRRRRRRQCRVELCRPEAPGDRHAEMPGRAERHRLPRLPDPDSAARLARHCHRSCLRCDASLRRAFRARRSRAGGGDRHLSSRARLAVVYGLLVTLGFALGPLGRARQLPASSSSPTAPSMRRGRPPLRYQLARAVALLLLAVMAVELGRTTASWRSSTSAPSSAPSWSCGWWRSPSWRWRAAPARVRGTSLRFAVRNIHRPGALTPSVVLSLGLGLTLLVSLALIDTNLRDQLSGTITEQGAGLLSSSTCRRASGGKFLDLVSRTAPEGDAPDRADAARAHRGGERRAERTKCGRKGRSSWALRGDRGITYSDTVPKNS